MSWWRSAAVVAADKRLELAYDAGQKHLAMQDATLGALRIRANNLLGTAALFTSLSAAIGLVNTDPNRGAVLAPWKAIVVVSVVAVLGLCVVFVLWPINKWRFGPDPSIILVEYRAGEDENAIRKLVIDAMITAIASNADALKWKQTAFRCAAALLVAEVVLLLLFLSFWK